MRHLYPNVKRPKLCVIKSFFIIVRVLILFILLIFISTKVLEASGNFLYLLRVRWVSCSKIRKILSQENFLLLLSRNIFFSSAIEKFVKNGGEMKIFFCKDSREKNYAGYFRYKWLCSQSSFCRLQIVGNNKNIY